ncbi:hypothetical protein ACJIZ3_017815 [Penstemon smallii]|uniref:DUF7731 domain-containing protein n=1 Tax=Penstemon smallii TaxID=265156 RepID=A0ABD3SX17_9LAMI
MRRHLQSQSVVGSISLLGLGLGLFISLLLSPAKAENRTDPTANQNLSPIEAWRSAEFCLQNISNVCPANYTLKESGWLNVTQAEGPAFCAAGGCADHTRDVLLCIEHVKRDYWFANNATIKDVNDTINLGCNSPQGFTGVSKYRSESDGHKLYSAPIFAALSSAAFLALITG